MATGDDALAAGMAIMSGSELANTLDTEMNKTRDYIAQRTNAVVPVAKGGTGATTASAARTALSVPSVSDLTTGLAGKANTSHTHSSIDSGGNHFAYEGSSVWGTDGALRVGGNATVESHIYVPASSAATSSFTVAYINGDGRLCRGSSSERYKKYISDADPLDLGDIFPQLQRYQMRSGDGAWMLGYIAEHLDADEATQPFVVRVDGEIESIDFIQLLLAQVANLNARLKALEGQA